MEGILFVSEGIVKARDISSVLEITEKKVYEIIELLEKEYIDENRGFILKRVAGGFRLYSNPALSEILIKFIKSNIRAHLSQAALETLAIISYRQPVTRTQVAEIRGVRTDSVIITLVDKGLIKEAGKLKEPGNPILYKVTDRFLELLGIESLKDLPPLEDMKENEEDNRNLE
ncbi:MAG: SMC-Scp complex subunit ScpB [Actinobacteria bacterium]|nr:SMC-Scp complex subunit ScpB [Actinomycetota bacterium]MBL7123286.1 SMC-Scp complex subunit ScpB [Actinomycetota bacterium]